MWEIWHRLAPPGKQALVVASPVMLKMAAWVVWAGLCSLVVAPGCRRNDVAERAHAPANREQGRARGAKLDLTPGVAEGRNRFQGDMLWQRAAGAEASEIDLVRLANREGAAGLLEGLNVGRTLGLTALAALPHAADAELALDRLCELLKGEGDPSTAPNVALLRSLHGIVARPPAPREALASRGYAGCLPVVERLAKSPNLDPERHDLASSAAGLLIEHRDAARR